MPLLSAGQAQKEITHNEALILLDSLICGCCAGAPSNDPRKLQKLGCPTLWYCAYGRLGRTAKRTGVLDRSGWRFVAPFEGLQVTDRSNGRVWRFASGQ
jgi:hypothetical protein